ncbi:MmpS family transport accessory protein [Streptomyces sp. NPDC052301]|uniref:MmpS family transport accessory protein n=1 Tax=Streptomyces sp. NPDC052301 TaxID=3365687 RepID=UPI0037CF50FA
MKSGFPRSGVTSLLAAGAAAMAAVSLTGCGLFGKSWDVKLEVTGPGVADISYSFAGDNDETVSARNLPWSRAQNVGFGFNQIGVVHAPDGTKCRIYVDGQLKIEEKKPDSHGTVSCFVNLQE